jgi:hypothetical protein
MLRVGDGKFPVPERILLRRLDMVTSPSPLYDPVAAKKPGGNRDDIREGAANGSEWARIKHSLRYGHHDAVAIAKSGPSHAISIRMFSVRCGAWR